MFQRVLDDNDHPLIQEILQDDNPLLKTISEPVTEFNDELKELVTKMTVTMQSRPGRGLAAIQIGVAKRVVIAYADKTMFVMVNPVFERKLNRFVTEREGCLSVPPVKWQNVSRPAKCQITWQDVDGNSHTDNFSGEAARVLQHEIDHLDGILITDHPIAR